MVPVVYHRWAVLVWFNLDFLSVWNDPLRVWDSWNVWGLKDSKNIWSLTEWAGSVEREGYCFHNMLQTWADLHQYHNLKYWHLQSFFYRLAPLNPHPSQAGQQEVRDGCGASVGVSVKCP